MRIYPHKHTCPLYTQSCICSKTDLLILHETGQIQDRANTSRDQMQAPRPCKFPGISQALKIYMDARKHALIFYNFVFVSIEGRNM